MKKLLTVLTVLLVLAAGLGLWGWKRYQSRFVYLGEVRYEKIQEALDLSGQPLPEPEELAQFTSLKLLDLRGTGLTGPEYDRLTELLPGCRILWDIPFQGDFYPMDTETLKISTLRDEDLDEIGYFSELKQVAAWDCRDYARLKALCDRYPEVQVDYAVILGDRAYSRDIGELTLSGADAGELARVLPYLTQVKSVTLEPPLDSGAALVALRDAFPEIRFQWQLEFKDMVLNESTRELDLTGIPTTVEEVTALIPYLPELTYLDMTNCGISNEEMDGLRRQFPEVKIVWTVTLGRWYRIRTDAIGFMPGKDNFFPDDQDLENLRYCTELVALDLGHQNITRLDFVAYMPHLKYLLLGDTRVRDLSPLTGLQELAYLELFLTAPQDLSPLVTLTGLEDLNLGCVQGDPEIVAQITWLKNLWWVPTAAWSVSPEQVQMLRDAIPDCHFHFERTSSTGGGWRQLPNYYAQRDIFGLEYMVG